MGIKMTVSELIKLLQEEDPNATIVIQVNWSGYYIDGYTESDNVECNGGSKRVVIFGDETYTDII